VTILEDYYSKTPIWRDSRTERILTIDPTDGGGRLSKAHGIGTVNGDVMKTKLARMCFGVSVVSLVSVSAGRAQTQTTAKARPSFEVASIKFRPFTPGPLRVSPGVDAAGIQYRNVTLIDCIRNAYGVQRYQIFGGSDWLRSDRYDILAKASSPFPKTQLMLMLQVLLEDRFRLKTHSETRELPIYALRVGQNGLQLKPGKVDGETQIGDGRHLINSRGMTMQALAGFLTQILQVSGRPVLDKTGLDGVFDITLDFVPDDLAVDNNSAPNVFAALQVARKLGKGKRVVTIIPDSAERYMSKKIFEGGE